jgi:DNA-binding beta-propeller fold protein YncE
VIPAPGSGDGDPNSAGLAFDGTYLWHADYGHQTIYKLDPADGTILDSFPSPGTCPSGLGYYAPGNVLVLGDCVTGELYQINASDGTVSASCGTPGGSPWGVAVTGATVWESDVGGFLYHIDSGPVATELQSWGSVKSTYR